MNWVFQSFLLRCFFPLDAESILSPPPFVSPLKDGQMNCFPGVATSQAHALTPLIFFCNSFLLLPSPGCLPKCPNSFRRGANPFRLDLAGLLLQNSLPFSLRILYCDTFSFISPTRSLQRSILPSSLFIRVPGRAFHTTTPGISPVSPSLRRRLTLSPPFLESGLVPEPFVFSMVERSPLPPSEVPHPKDHPLSISDLIAPPSSSSSFHYSRGFLSRSPNISSQPIRISRYSACSFFPFRVPVSPPPHPYFRKVNLRLASRRSS